MATLNEIKEWLKTQSGIEIAEDEGIIAVTINLDEGEILRCYMSKACDDGTWINIFMALNGISDSTWEGLIQHPFGGIAKLGQIYCLRHSFLAEQFSDKSFYLTIALMHRAVSELNA
jgi:hypothetical protein